MEFAGVVTKDASIKTTFTIKTDGEVGKQTAANIVSSFPY